MRICELINQDELANEMAMVTYKPIGDFNKPGPFIGADKNLVPHQKNIEKTAKFFENTPYNFRFFFSNIPGTGKYSEYGAINPDELIKIFKKDAEEIISGSENSITVVFVGNKGADKKLLSPWLIGHRFGHAIQSTRNKNPQISSAWGAAEKTFFDNINYLLREYYGKSSKNYSTHQIKWDMSAQYSALFNAIGTQRSSRTGQIKRPYEFLYEIFAQYLKSGEVRLNPLPERATYGRKAWGKPTNWLSIQQEYRDELSRTQESERVAANMSLAFDKVLRASVGKIYLM